MDPSREVKPDPRRALPAVDRLLSALRAAHPDLPGWAAREAVRRALASERERLAGAEASDRVADPQGELLEAAAARAFALCGRHPRRVVNATGTVLHTNLGRAPLAPGAAAAVAAAAACYSDLEMDLATGERGDRLAGVAEKLVLISGAEAAFAVNNNAAALLLALDTLARGREVIVSRGELVEIGGSFRVPEIIERAGVRLVDVGTTNRTHRGDYERAITPQTGVLLKVHRSNFELRGFVAEVTLAELAELGRERGLPVVEDLGSGTLVDLKGQGLPAEAYAPARLQLGAEVVCFSGDKLLGGPQAGILLGSARCIEALRANPLARALRLDKLSLAALDWTLEACLDGRAEREIPVLRQLLQPAAALEMRARQLAKRLAAVAGSTLQATVQPDRAVVGGGSLPGFELDSWVVALELKDPETVATRLRGAPVPVLARVRGGRLLFDVRTLLDDDESALEAALGAALRTALR
ncbi:MAG: L-seryl-tRNA(Sec) selenium transferase [Myxococcales bacterium]|nr:L-seryl-tRNA(Sec) selenium transferase [Myxococcales bacterium]